ncbi:PREDICTED: solute carrier family 22 member 20-like [Odobenus rosmarus divergens]|uniref:Solute carrier family 22 member 20-like n=1 Tax=Odobenus rosmarus divergens TaxID=9708 RepID=A0A9B0G747_ODORO
MGFSDLLHTIGGMGNFQILQTILMMFPAILIACHSFLQNFTATTPEHHCRPANWTNGSHVPDGVGDGDLLQVFIPLDKDQKPERCLRFSEPHWQILNLNGTSSLSLDTEACLDGWVYNQTVGSSIVSEWDLVCEHKSLKSIAQSIYMTGQLVGATAFGIFSDRCGRKTALQSGTLLMIIMGTSAAFAPSFPAYCVLRFLSGVAMTGIIITSLCLAMEWTPTQRRTLVNIYTMYMITLGQVVLTGLAYLIQQWRWLQGTVSVAYLIILLYSWFSTGFSFYGLGLDVQRFGFNIYWTQVLFTVVDIPTKLMTGLSMAYFGRRITTVSLLLVAGCTILVTAFLPQGNHSPLLQPVIFGLVPIVAAAAGSFLVETNNQPLLNTIQETEKR